MDHHVRCGNSLLGAAPELVAGGIPDEACAAIEGDDKKACAQMKKTNRKEREQEGMAGQGTLFGYGSEGLRVGEALSRAARELDGVDDADARGIRLKQEGFDALLQSAEYVRAKQAADAWCAAFVWKKTGEFPHGITTGVLHQIESRPTSVEPWLLQEVRRLADEYGFFHWHIAFPELFTPPLPTPASRPPTPGPRPPAPGSRLPAPPASTSSWATRRGKH